VGAPTATGLRGIVPNALTLGRLAVIPVYAALVLSSAGGMSWPAAVIFAAAGITDQIDGFLARRWRAESKFGKIADPLADRILIDVAVLLLWHAGRLPWVALAIPARDILLIAATPFALGRGYRFEVNLTGKTATWVLYAGLALIPCTSPSTHWPLWIFWAGLALAVAAVALYVRKARQEFGRPDGT